MARSQHVCLKCNGCQETCCMLGVVLCYEDIRKIMDQGYDPEDFCELEEWDDEDLEGYEDWWKDSMVEIDGKKYKIYIRLRENDHCYFLEDKKGCVLEERPLQCRIYPFWVKKGEIIYDMDDDDFCYFNRNKASIEEGMNLIGETDKSIKDYFERIKKSCKEDKEEYEKLAKSLFEAKDL